MPWSLALESTWCAGCGMWGHEYTERRPFVGSGPRPGAQARVCARCFLAGWRLVGPGIEAGRFTVRGYRTA